MNILDWFDVTNLEHLKAYDILMKTGKWEEGFIPEGMEFPYNWHLLLMGKFVDAYIREKLSKVQI